MVLVNENYLKLTGAYLFPEIARRVRAFSEADPAAGGRIINCGIGDVTEPLPQAAVDAVHRAIDEMSRRETFRGYGPGTGYDFLHEAIVEHEFRARGLEMAPDEIFVSDGSKGDCGHILEILGTGNRVAVADPVYPVYVDTNVMAGNTGPAGPDGAFAGITYLPCTPANDFIPTPPPPDDPKVVYLCFPNNPTGAMIDRARLQAWVDYALAHDALLLYDVAYQAYISDPGLPRSVYEIEGARRCAIEFHSFSKNGGFTGLRCGFTVCPKTVTGRTGDGREVALHDLWVRRWNTRANGVSYPVQRAAEALYGPAGRAQVSSLVEHYLGNTRILRAGCEAAGLKAYGGLNAPYVWVSCPDGVGSWAMFDRMLAEAQVVVVPGCGFGACGEGFFRISAFNTRQNVEEVVTRLGRLAPAGIAAP